MECCFGSIGDCPPGEGQMGDRHDGGEIMANRSRQLCYEQYSNIGEL